MVSAAGLRQIDRPVREADELRGVSCIVREDGDPEAGRDRTRDLGHGDVASAARSFSGMLRAPSRRSKSSLESEVTA